MTREQAENEEGEAAPSDAEFESLLRRAAHVDEYAPVRLPRPGEILADKYRIEALLGRGGMGAVFRATHVVSEKPVAIKWMLRSAADERAYRRFVREARVTGRIDHPNVVDVYDIGRQDNTGYLVMELLHGESLRERLAHARPSVAECIDLLLPAMRGVSAAHAAGVIHRDLKPDNIFLCKGPDGSAREAKVLDFGISAMLVAQGNESTLTNDGTLIGTPAYMSPEQVSNGHPIDARADVYAFGVILFEMLAGTLPYAASSYSALILAIATQPPRNLLELRPDVPAGLARVVLRALEKRKEDRYESVDHLSSALLPYASATSGSTSPGPATARPRVSRSAWRWWLSAVATVTVSGLVATWLYARAHVAPGAAQAHSSEHTDLPIPATRALESRPTVRQQTAIPEPPMLEPRTASMATGTNPIVTASEPLKSKHRPTPAAHTDKPPRPAPPDPSTPPEVGSSKRRAGSISIDEL
jgi:serine/threonine-protein kinase